MNTKPWVLAVGCGLLLAASAAAQCVTALVPVSQPVLFPNHAAGPIAFTGSLYGVAKLDADPANNAIYFGVYDANLNQIRPDRLVAASTLAGPRLLLWNGTEFALFYETRAFQITLQRIDVNANPIGGPITIAPLHAQAFNQEYDAAWDPTRKAYIVLHTVTGGFDAGLWMTVVAADGTQKSDEPVTFFVSTPVYPRVAVTPSGVIGIAYSRSINGGQQELAFSIVTPGAPATAIATVRAGGANPRLATDGKFFFLVYTVPVTGGNAMRSVKYDTAGRVAAADALLVSGATDVLPFSLIANPTLSEWAVLYVQYPAGVLNPSVAETRLRRIPFTAGTTTDIPFILDSAKRSLGPQSELTWNGSGYVASVGRVLSLTEGTESYLARHCPFVVSIAASATLTVPNAPITFTANPSSGAAPYTYVWSFGDISSSERGQIVTHAYRDVGTYTVTVTATDRDGANTTTSITVTIANLRRRAAKH
jgi:PKD domain